MIFSRSTSSAALESFGLTAWVKAPAARTRSARRTSAAADRSWAPEGRLPKTSSERAEPSSALLILLRAEVFCGLGFAGTASWLPFTPFVLMPFVALPLAPAPIMGPRTAEAAPSTTAAEAKVSPSHDSWSMAEPCACRSACAASAGAEAAACAALRSASCQQVPSSTLPMGFPVRTAELTYMSTRPTPRCTCSTVDAQPSPASAWKNISDNDIWKIKK
mmetsp:Transcript_93474/g.243466  ORF Transcript_93474/g.243466 Transcript_93474/m.243466 type:complete len:219 (-) Transcript_93474:128-784(-)